MASPKKSLLTILKFLPQYCFKEVCEKAAYTWFNRLIALVILEHNGYEGPQLQYLGDATVPAMLERARRGQHAFLKPGEAARLQPLLADYTRETEAFAGLITAYCHEHRLLHALFGVVADYTELLLPADMLLPGGFLHLLNTTDAFTETGADGRPDRSAAFRKAELIGWLYQFYIAQRKDEVFAGFKKGAKATAADIPAATQIFTPAWIVKYMVQNTLGRT